MSFFPELDFSVFDTLEQFEAVWPAEAREGGAVTSALKPIVWAGGGCLRRTSPKRSCFATSAGGSQPARVRRQCGSAPRAGEAPVAMSPGAMSKGISPIHM